MKEIEFDPGWDASGVLPELMGTVTTQEGIDIINAMRGWISVKDRLPDNNKYIIACGMHEEEHVIRTCLYQAECSKTIKDTIVHWGERWIVEGCCCDIYIEDVTHWMPLPEKPHELD